MSSGPRIAVVTWAFNETGEKVAGVVVGSTSWILCPAYHGHPGHVDHQYVDLGGDDALAGLLREDLAIAANPHDCLPSPICEVCGREAKDVQQAMANAVLELGAKYVSAVTQARDRLARLKD